MGDIENLLRDFGLTEYEIKALVTLLKLKIATADQISEVGNIPLPRVYDTLTELKDKGFVLISKTRPKKFKPTAPEKALNNLIKVRRERFEQGIVNLESNIKKLNKIVTEIEPLGSYEKTFEIWSTEKRSNMQAMFNETENKAKKEILIFAGDMSWLPERIDNLKNAIKNGVKVKALIAKTDSKEIDRHINKIKKMGAEIKFGHQSPLRGEIIDENSALIAFKSSNVKEDETKSRYELTIFENPVMIKVLKENFNFWWDKLKS